MANRASPPRRVAAWTKTAATTEAVPTARASFINLEASHVVHANGFAQGVYAILPDKHDYDRIRISFGPVTKGNADNVATAAVYAMLSDDSRVLLGTSALASGSTVIAPIEFENFQAVYAVVLLGVAGTGAAITTQVFVQGVYQGYLE
jgi:hypothetical protein